MAAFRYIFYSGVALLLLIAGWWFRPEATLEFFQSLSLYRDSILATVVAGISLSILGVYILLNRIVFVSLAVAQSAGFGIFLTLFLGVWWGFHAEDMHLPFVAGLSLPFLIGVVFAMLTAGLFGVLRRYKSFSESSLVALIYIISTGMIQLIGNLMAQEKHEIDHLLFGNVVTVFPEELQMILLVTVFIAITHLLYRREFLYISADPVFMKTKGLSTKTWTVLLYFLFSLGIASSLKILGSLSTFALIVMPAFMALRRARSLSHAFWLALLLGCLMPALGFYFSHLLEFPAGASIILVGIVFLAANMIESKIYR